jgi:hypothetical protein
MTTLKGYILIKAPELKELNVDSTSSKESKNQQVVESKVIMAEPPSDNAALLQMKGKSASGTSIRGLPPQLDATQGFRKKFRYIFQGTSGTNQSLVTVGTAMMSFGCMAISTSQVSSIISSFKLHSITIYPAAGASNTYLEWVDAVTTGEHMKDSRKMRPVPTGITISEPIRYVPPSGSEASFWQDALGTANSLFAVLGTAGSIMDVDATVTILNTGNNVQQTGFTSLTTGFVYYPAIDGRVTNRIAAVGRTGAT